MKPGLITVLIVLGVLAAGAAFASCGTRYDAAAATPEQLAMCTDYQGTAQYPAYDLSTSVTTDNQYVYVVKGNELLKMTKDNLCVVARTPLPQTCMACVGRGPGVGVYEGTPLYPSGSDIDYYAPTGVPVAPVYRAYPNNY